jgi:hypothetical protein
LESGSIAEETLAKHDGIDVAGVWSHEDWRRVEGMKNQFRGGVLGMGAIACRTQRVLYFGPESEQFPDDDEANALLTKQDRSPRGLERTWTS